MRVLERSSRRGRFRRRRGSGRFAFLYIGAPPLGEVFFNAAARRGFSARLSKTLRMLWNGAVRDIRPGMKTAPLVCEVCAMVCDQLSFSEGSVGI